MVLIIHAYHTDHAHDGLLVFSYHAHYALLLVKKCPCWFDFGKHGNAALLFSHIMPMVLCCFIKSCPCGIISYPNVLSLFRSCTWWFVVFIICRWRVVDLASHTHDALFDQLMSMTNCAFISWWWCVVVLRWRPWWFGLYPDLPMIRCIVIK